jgi:hypothetical protein
VHRRAGCTCQHTQATRGCSQARLQCPRQQQPLQTRARSCLGLQVWPQHQQQLQRRAWHAACWGACRRGGVGGVALYCHNCELCTLLFEGCSTCTATVVLLLTRGTGCVQTLQGWRGRLAWFHHTQHPAHRCWQLPCDSSSSSSSKRRCWWSRMTRQARFDASHDAASFRGATCCSGSVWCQLPHLQVTPLATGMPPAQHGAVTCGGGVVGQVALTPSHTTSSSQGLVAGLWWQQEQQHQTVGRP